MLRLGASAACCAEVRWRGLESGLVLVGLIAPAGYGCLINTWRGESRCGGLGAPRCPALRQPVALGMGCGASRENKAAEAAIMRMSSRDMMYHSHDSSPRPSAASSVGSGEGQSTLWVLGREEGNDAATDGTTPVSAASAASGVGSGEG